MNYIDEYNPEEEDIFGDGIKVRPKRILPSAQQIADPLRKWKIRLNSFLTAEKLPITAAALEKRMWDEQCIKFQNESSGFATFEDLLSACSDAIIRERLKDGSFVYSAKTNEANSAIREMVAQQHENGEQPRGRSFFSTKKRLNGSYGSSFRKYTGATMAKEKALALSAEKRAFARNNYPKTAAKTVERMKVISQFLADEWLSISEPHPMDPNDAQKSIVTLAKLQSSFSSAFSLPMWGKEMSEKDLYHALDQPPFNSHLKMWVLPGKSVVYVEPILVDLDENENISTKEEEPHKEEISHANNSLVKMKASEVAETEMERLNLLEEWKDTDGQFARGPGFAEVTQNATKYMVNENEKTPRAAPKNEQKKEEIGFNFGQGPQFQTEQRSRANYSNVSGGERKDELRNISRGPLDRRTMPVEYKQPAMNDTALKQLALFCLQKGSLNFEHLNDNEKRIVNHSAHVFRTISVSLGETMVMVHDDVDIEHVVFKYGNLRGLVESDVRWMSNVGRVKSDYFLGRIVHFVPPRGFLIIDLASEEDDTKNMDKMNDIVANARESERRPLEMKDVYPGMACAYHYNAGDSSQWFRALIVRSAPEKSESCLGGVLLDAHDRYFCDIEVSELYTLPSKASLQNHPSNVIFAVLCSVDSICERVQNHIVKLLDEEDTEYKYNKPACPSHIQQNGGLAVPMFDMVWLNDNQRCQWFTKILQDQGGSTFSNEIQGFHSKHPDQMYEKFCGPEMWQFKGPSSVVDNRNIENEEFQSPKHECDGGTAELQLELDEEIILSNGKTSLVRDDQLFETPTLISPEDLFATFQHFANKKKIHAISSLLILTEALGKETKDEFYMNAVSRMRRVIQNKFDIDFDTN